MRPVASRCPPVVCFSVRRFYHGNMPEFAALLVGCGCSTYPSLILCSLSCSSFDVVTGLAIMGPRPRSATPPEASSGLRPMASRASHLAGEICYFPGLHISQSREAVVRLPEARVTPVRSLQRSASDGVAGIISRWGNLLFPRTAHLAVPGSRCEAA
ncbi:hypothetical protein NDU88_005700 [Pleurodeles waltl]|uniref:Uncharacterized protein n=1 Tax=Pleurodeles waltl TaxID=8319 RepID=A0AAV7W8J7_PLEWA|nr:hypothetical protein NDU88_005700 [Pleurodeles waltl]